MFVISLRHGKQPRKRKSKVSINSETRWIYRDEMVIKKFKAVHGKKFVHWSLTYESLYLKFSQQSILLRFLHVIKYVFQLFKIAIDHIFWE